MTAVLSQINVRSRTMEKSQNIMEFDVIIFLCFNILKMDESLI